MSKHLLFLSSLSVLLIACESSTMDHQEKDSSIEKIQESEEDRSITQRIYTALSKDTSLTDSKSIHVTTLNGLVTLTGTIANEAEKKDLTRKIKGMQGVNGVDNQLTHPQQ